MTPFQLLLMMIAILPYTALILFEQPSGSLPLILFGFLSYAFYFYKHDSRIKNITFWESVKDDLPSYISPFQIFLVFIFCSTIWIFFIDEHFNLFYIFFTLLILYSIFYYISVARLNNDTILHTIKEDFLQFSKPDMTLTHFIIFLLISSPFIVLIVALIMGVF